MFYFNFYELRVITEDQIDAIFTLICGMSLGYNKYRFDNLEDFRRRCYPLQEIPQVIRRNNIITKEPGGYGYSINYKVRIPLSYITNRFFLIKKGPSIRDKVQYLKLLSYRSIKNTNTWIDQDILVNTEKIKYNPFITLKDNKIYFNYEKEIIQ